MPRRCPPIPQQPVGSIEEGVRVRGERAVEPALRLRPCRVIAADISGLSHRRRAPKLSAGDVILTVMFSAKARVRRWPSGTLACHFDPPVAGVLNFHRKYSVLALGEAMKRRE